MKIYKKLFAYVQDKKYLGFFAIIFSAISAVLTVYGYYLIYRFLDNLIIHTDLSGAENLAIKSALILTAGAIFYFASGAFSHLLGFRLETNLRKRGIDGLENASFRFFDLNPSGKIRKIIDDNAAQTHQVVAHMIPDSSQAIITPVLVLVLGFIVSIRVGIALLALTIIGCLILGAMMGEQKFMKIYQEALSKLSAETVEYVRGMQVVKIFRANVESFKSFYKAIKDYSKYAYNYSLSCKKPYVLYQWLFFGLIAILIIPIVYFMTSLGSAKMILLELIMILFLSGVLFVSFMRMMWYSLYISQGNYAVDTLEALYKEMQKDKLEHGNLNNFKNYNIEFDNVSFAYNDKAVIENLSFSLQEGKSYALVGSSGSGKSTVAKLISGFYNVNEGSIKIGGMPISEYSDEALIKAISFVFQDSKLFKKSIYENVALANKDAVKDDVMRALRLAGCDLILDKFPEREKTIIGSKGVYLSGGEKQRIAIARAILKDSKIIIMDEASASIDPDNEFELQKAFKNLMKDKTVIMIAHRLSTIKDVDEILVMDNGKIIERGSDKELMSRDTRYKRLQELFNSANEWRVLNEGVL
ncbi:MAG: ABC transporter ATP-binding protein [Negativicoccus succinicivorans]|uniref:ABC transporter ATP-binding protein n=1 Tax=Negativicoccus succinicivorans TaxID=620903 RepID=UPI0023525F49|nr:ABC transporter ATP-binding protein [Negativicoccus succinicivorans]MBS5890830.1 ABC transporter ATP-binding protein [Negativicoccus succinicivorans]MDU1066738.1 ABC transporter ATP-binding protein [Negativicoccus succinicivorans]